MEIRLVPGAPGRRRTDLAVAYQFQGSARLLGGGDPGVLRRLARMAKADRFRPQEGELFLWHASGGAARARRWLLVGLGERGRFSPERQRRACARVVARARKIGARDVSLPLLPQAPGAKQPAAIVERMGAALAVASHRFDKYRSRPQRSEAPRRVDLCTGVERSGRELQKALRRGRLEAQAVILARDLVNEPGGALPPSALAQRARQVARQSGLRCQVLDERGLRRLRMGAILGVGMGSSQPPCLIHLTYRPRGRPRARVALVGKGITFDSGGLSLKPATSMEDMKSDKAGASAVLGVMSVLPEIGLPIEVHGIIAAAENMPGGRALRPGDVVRTCSGKTVEVLNTDAEGRLLLADALTYAARQKVDEIVDIATLTGACMIALGASAAGVMGNRPALVARLRRAADETGEKLWELPLIADYREQLRSSIADLRNTGDRYGGAIIAGLFLEQFVDRRQAWAHMDIAGPAFSGKGREDAPKGATGVPVPTLLRYLELVARGQ